MSPSPASGGRPSGAPRAPGTAGSQLRPTGSAHQARGSAEERWRSERQEGRSSRRIFCGPTEAASVPSVGGAWPAVPVQRSGLAHAEGVRMWRWWRASWELPEGPLGPQAFPVWHLWRDLPDMRTHNSERPYSCSPRAWRAT